MNLATLEDLHQFKVEVLEAIKSINPDSKNSINKWVKTRKAREILECSPGTLRNLRLKGIIESSKISGSIYYSLDSINKVLENNKTSTF